MYCPQCGQQQITDAVRFCSRCGFPLDGVIHLLHNRGMLPAGTSSESSAVSPRRRGVKQGGILLLSGALVVPILGVLNSFSTSMFVDVLVAIAAILCFIGGPLRMIYAALFEEGAPLPYRSTSYAPPPPSAIRSPAQGVGALPPRPANPASGWRRPNTAELAQPPSVTENTTRLLNQDEPREQ